MVDQDVENPQERLLELQDKVDEFFSEHGTVYAVRLRKTDERPSKFKVTKNCRFEEDARSS